MGIVTDRDLRNRVLAVGRGLDTPVIDVATRPVRSIAAGTPVYDAWHLLVQHGVHHLPVMRGDAVVGILSDTDLLRHQTSGPTALFARIERLSAPDETRGYAVDVTRMVGTLVDAGLDVTKIARLVSRLNDALVGRLLLLVESDLGPRPCDYAWVVFGAEGRYEQLLIADQDNALVYADDTSEAHEYFGRLATRVVGDLETAGFPRCPGGYMATTWHAPLETWAGRFDAWIHEPSGQALLDAATFFDGRPAYGALDVDPIGRVILGARDQGAFLASMANEALRFRPPLGPFGHLRGGDRIDLKRDGLAPVVGLARVLALAGGIRAHSTHARLAAAADQGLISEEGAATLQEAYRFLLGLRLRFQLEAIRRGREPVATLSDADLRVVEVRHLKDAFRAIRDAQEALALKYRTDRF
jgi:CBS domain-containing protein